MKTNMHRLVYRDASGRRMVTVEGINVCICAWMHISGVLEATFYHYQKKARANVEPESMVIRDWQKQGSTLNRQQQR